MSLLSKIVKDKNHIKETDVNLIFSKYSRQNVVKEIEKKPGIKPVAKEINLAFNEAEQAKRKIINSAKKEAEKILDEVNDQIIEARQLGYGDGFDKGYEEGLAKARNETAEVVQRAQSIAEQALNDKKNAILKSEPQIIELAIDLAKRIIESEIKADPTLIVNIAKKAISKVVEAERVRLRVNPEDAEQVKDHIGEISSSGGIISKIDIVTDVEIERGGCIIDFDNGSIDARLSTQIDEFGKILRQNNGE